MYLNHEAIVHASLDMNYRTVLCGAVNDFCLPVEDVERCFNAYNQKNSLISYILGFSHEYTNSKEKIQQVAALSHKYKAPVYTHLSETEYEVNNTKKNEQIKSKEISIDTIEVSLSDESKLVKALNSILDKLGLDNESVS